MPVAIPFIAAAAGAAASAVIGGGVLGAVAAAGAALVVSAVGAAVFRPKSPSAARSANVTPGTDTGPGSGFDPRTPGAGRTQSFRADHRAPDRLRPLPHLRPRGVPAFRHR